MSDVQGKAPIGSLAKPAPKGKKPPKRIKQIGKRTLTYNQWRDKVAKPYLDSAYGRLCKWCGSRDELDIDHILPRGSHPELKMDLGNVRYLCRRCHSTRA